MGAYGSPDTGNLYTEEKPIKKRKSFKISAQAIMWIVLYLILMINNNDRFVMTVSFIGVMAMVYFAINLIKMIVKLFKKQSVNSEVIKIFVCIALFIICGILI